MTNSECIRDGLAVTVRDACGLLNGEEGLHLRVVLGLRGRILKQGESAREFLTHNSPDGVLVHGRRDCGLLLDF
jgi:hypothetical protein